MRRGPSCTGRGTYHVIGDDGQMSVINSDTVHSENARPVEFRIRNWLVQHEKAAYISLMIAARAASTPYVSRIAKMSLESILVMSMRSSATRQMAGRLDPSVMISRCNNSVSTSTMRLTSQTLTVNSPLSLKTFIHLPIFGTSWMTAFRQHLSITSTKRSF